MSYIYGATANNQLTSNPKDKTTSIILGFTSGKTGKAYICKSWKLIMDLGRDPGK